MQVIDLLLTPLAEKTVTSDKGSRIIMAHHTQEKGKKMQFLCASSQAIDKLRLWSCTRLSLDQAWLFMPRSGLSDKDKNVCIRI